MSQQIEAVYENGALRPLEPLRLAEHRRVMIVIVEGGTDEEGLFDPAFTHWCAEQSSQAPSLAEVRQALATIEGLMADVVRAARDEH